MKTATNLSLLYVLKKIHKYLLLSIISLILLGFLIIVSIANWEDLETIILTISFSNDVSQDWYSIKMIDDENIVEIEEVVQNPTFSQGLEGWGVIGHVDSFGGYESYVQFGFEGSSNLIHENCITQNIELLTSKQLRIDYQWHTLEDLAGFDQLSLAVLINDELLHLESAPSFANEQRQELILKLPVSNSQLSELKICAGNTGDRSISSWLKLYQVSTYVVAINTSQELEIKAENAFIHIHYKENGITKDHSSLDELLLSFDNNVDDDLLLIEIEQQEQQHLVKVQLPTYVSTTSPSMSETKVCKIDATHYAVSTDFLESKLNLNWQLVYFVDKFNEFLVEETNLANRYFPNWPLSLIPPICLRESCILYFNMDELIDTDLESLSFHFRSCDLTGLCSDFVEATLLNSCQDFFDQAQPSQTSIMVNEIMFNPLGPDTGDWYDGEWIELFNPNEYDIDLINWKIEDEAGWEIPLTQHSCDNNHDTTDFGETVIPAGGYLVVFTRGRAILNNTGDTVYLLDSNNQLIDEISYPGSSVENKTYGRFPDGSDQWFPRMPSTPLATNQKD